VSLPSLKLARKRTNYCSRAHTRAAARLSVFQASAKYTFATEILYLCMLHLYTYKKLIQVLKRTLSDVIKTMRGDLTECIFTKYVFTNFYTLYYTISPTECQISNVFLQKSVLCKKTENRIRTKC
jgi:hypothetical protein